MLCAANQHIADPLAAVMAWGKPLAKDTRNLMRICMSVIMDDPVNSRPLDLLSRGEFFA
jgi:hypothetical protein